MKRLISSIILLFIFLPIVQAENPDELSAIKETALNYMDSWYKGDSKKMKQSLQKKLAKRSLQESVSGKKLLRQTSFKYVKLPLRGERIVCLFSE